MLRVTFFLRLRSWENRSYDSLIDFGTKMEVLTLYWNVWLILRYQTRWRWHDFWCFWRIRTWFFTNWWRLVFRKLTNWEKVWRFWENNKETVYKNIGCIESPATSINKSLNRKIEKREGIQNYMEGSPDGVPNVTKKFTLNVA